MPVILCNWCAKPTTLPDGWTRTDYECPHCGKRVALTLTAAAQPAQSQPPAVNVRATFHWGNVLLLVLIGMAVIIPLMYLAKGMKDSGVIK